MKTENFQKYFSIALKLILILSIINAIDKGFWHILSINSLLLILLFTPEILKSSKVNFPKEIEWLLLIFILITLFLGKAKAFIAPILFGVGAGFIGLMFLFILSSLKKVKKHFLLMILASFSFAISLGVGIELAKFYLKLLLNQNIGNIYEYTMMNLTYVLIGSVLASLIGIIYLKTRLKIFDAFARKIKKTNPKLFEPTKKEILSLIKNGESDELEFKSTIRTNLYTNQPDKKIEFSILKTIVSFLNSQGGILLIGISDKGNIQGIEKDNFKNIDKAILHLTNLIKQKIGKRYLNQIKIQPIILKKKQVLKIEIKPSKEPIFLEQDKKQEFYIRIGPSSNPLQGKELLDYIKKRFEKK
jgi:hypothetical protein